METISVIIPAYNASKYLSATIDSVIAQTFQDWELIIVDDGSQDDTAILAEEYVYKDPRIRLVTQENKGVAEARTTGFRHSHKNTEYVIFLDADDLWETATLATLMQTL